MACDSEVHYERLPYRKEFRDGRVMTSGRSGCATAHFSLESWLQQRHHWVVLVAI